ncbi:MAG: KamA family radical SAM protein, partial [Planctomycetota bacterium]
ITPYYLTLMAKDDPEDALLRQVVPLVEEHEHRADGDEDPLGEESFSPVPGITHRYPDRCLMVVSNSCAIYCRYCTRKRIMYEDAVPEMELQAMVDYIARTPSIRDVVVSGGDPLTYSTDKLERILSKLRAIPHLEIIRIGSRVPVSLPMRVTDELCDMLAQYHPLWINVHFNHPSEITPDAARACDKLIRAGIPLNNQSVLLRGVNDSVATTKDLVHGLMKMRVRPYYLYICDPVRGANHFRTTVAKGLEIMEGLRGHTSGLAIPQFVVDAPGGGGKLPVNPQYLLAYDNGRSILRNFQGKVFEYQDPIERPGGSMPPARLANKARKLDALAPNGYVRPDMQRELGVGLGNRPDETAPNGPSNGGCGSFANTLAQLVKVNGNSQVNGKGHANGNGHANGDGHANGSGQSNGGGPAPVVGKSGWAHRRENGAAGCGG